jgi:hypothetical protein
VYLQYLGLRWLHFVGHNTVICWTLVVLLRFNANTHQPCTHSLLSRRCIASECSLSLHANFIKSGGRDACLILTSSICRVDARKRPLSAPAGNKGARITMQIIVYLLLRTNVMFACESRRRSNFSLSCFHQPNEKSGDSTKCAAKLTWLCFKYRGGRWKWSSKRVNGLLGRASWGRIFHAI